MAKPKATLQQVREYIGTPDKPCTIPELRNLPAEDLNELRQLVTEVIYPS